MSKLLKEKLKIPNSTKIKIIKNLLLFENNASMLLIKIPLNIIVSHKNNCLLLKTTTNHENVGTFYANIRNVLEGVAKGYVITLVLVGMNYRLFVKKNKLFFRLGHVNTVKVTIPDEIYLYVSKNNNLYMYCANLQQLTQFVARIRSIKKPDIYKGKGIFFIDEERIKKQGKKK
jgi:large subunit ribosomal protein L6